MDISNEIKIANRIECLADVGAKLGADYHGPLGDFGLHGLEDLFEQISDLSRDLSVRLKLAETGFSEKEVAA